MLVKSWVVISHAKGWVVLAHVKFWFVLPNVKNCSSQDNPIAYMAGQPPSPPGRGIRQKLRNKCTDNR